VLVALKKAGWRHVILSNHVPELSDIVNGLRLSPYIDDCISSGATGYEKPNPQAFKLAIFKAGNPETAWMVGDNLLSDIRGAEAMGIPAILVHIVKPDGIKYYAPDLRGAAAIIKGK
jgi:putative hydrolase of the HAD superfamily